MFKLIIFIASLLAVATSASLVQNCSQHEFADQCLAFEQCAWCNGTKPPNWPGGVCYDRNTEHCCDNDNQCERTPFYNSACLKSQTCCIGLYSPATCCDEGMECCQGVCYDPKKSLLCCPASYPDDFCGWPAVCDPYATCCPAYLSQCCPAGTYCCSDYHGTNACLPNEYPVMCGGPFACGNSGLCPANTTCNCKPPNGGGPGCLFHNGTCVPAHFL